MTLMMEKKPSSVLQQWQLVLRAYHAQLFLMKGTSKQGGPPVDTAINGSRVDPPENHAVGDPGNVHMDGPGDIINCADDAHPKSPEDHD